MADIVAGVPAQFVFLSSGVVSLTSTLLFLLVPPPGWRMVKPDPAETGSTMLLCQTILGFGPSGPENIRSHENISGDLKGMDTHWWNFDIPQLHVCRHGLVRNEGAPPMRRKI